jgi:hypothetical protein
VGAGRVVGVRDGAGATVRVRAGAVWFTQENDPHDRLVRAGDSVTLDRPGLALFQAPRERGARLSVQPLQPLGQRPRGVEAVERGAHRVAQLLQALLRQRMRLE